MMALAILVTSLGDTEDLRVLTGASIHKSNGLLRDCFCHSRKFLGAPEIVSPFMGRGGMLLSVRSVP